MIKNIYIFSIVLFIGCSSPPLIERITVRERVDSLIVRYDTVYVSAPSDTVYVERSSIDTYAFKTVSARLDTTISGITLFARYSYPPDKWWLNITRKDEVIKWVVRDSIIDKPYEVEVVPFWVKLTLVLAAIVVIAVLVKR